MDFAITRFVKINIIIIFAMPLSGLAQVIEDDPLAEALKGELTPSVEVFLDFYREKRKYRNEDFPLNESRFSLFKTDVTLALEQGLGISDWVVRSPRGKASPIAALYSDRLIETRTIHGVAVEIHAVTITPTGLTVPMVVCLPTDSGSQIVPGVCVFSGHTRHGLNDLVANLDSYQQGVAIRLAQAGIASIAVEKIDTGYLSRNGFEGVDESEIATLMLSWGSVLRSHQLRACLAAIEILAGHERIDETRIGATGVSLGGWLTVQSALLNDRIKAVADFGRKTRSIASDMTAANYKGQGDLCHIIPGMLSLCDRNLQPLALAPMPMLSGHGRKDSGSHREHETEYRLLGESQYAALGKSEDYSYLVHDGGDTMPSNQVIAWFRNRFQVEP